MRTLLLSVISVLVACSKGGDSKPSGDDKVACCNPAMKHSCWQFSAANIAAAGSDELAKLCKINTASGALSMTPCPTAGLMSTCATREKTEFLYDGFPGDRPELEKDCTDNGGTFTWKK